MQWSDPFTAPRDVPKLVDVVRPHLAVLARREIGRLLKAGGILLDGAVGGINDPVAAGAELRVDMNRLAALAAAQRTIPPSPVPVRIEHADDDLLVVVKPPGMHVAPLGPHRDDTLVGALLWRAGARADQPWTTHRPTPSHRLDRPTSGLVLFATSHEVQATLQASMEAGEIRRDYIATVEGEVEGETGTIDAAVGRDPVDERRRAVRADGQRAITEWRVAGRSRGRTTVALTLGTGRTHQLRVHLASIGHPIVGDSTYGASSHPAPTDLGSRIALHAARLTFPHPRTGTTIEVTACSR